MPPGKLFMFSRKPSICTQTISALQQNVIHSVFENTEGKKPLLFLFGDRQEHVYFYQIAIHVWRCLLGAFSCWKSKTFIPYNKHPAYVSRVCAVNKGGRKSWKTSYVFACELPLGNQGKGHNSHRNGQRYPHSTVPSNHQIQKKFLVLILALLQTSGNHWGLANNLEY